MSAPAYNQYRDQIWAICMHPLQLGPHVASGRSPIPIGDLIKILEENEHLKDTARSGHKWWILPEEVPTERQVDISLWRNMDQNENQVSHEIEILQGIKATAESISVKARKLSQVDLKK